MKVNVEKKSQFAIIRRHPSIKLLSGFFFQPANYRAAFAIGYNKWKDGG